MGVEHVHAGANHRHVPYAEAQQRPQRRAQVAAVGNLAEHRVVFLHVQRVRVFFKGDGRKAVVLFGFPPQHPFRLFPAHSVRLTQGGQFFHPFVAPAPPDGSKAAGPSPAGSASG